ncbi:hypothetical protein ABZ863_00775 [Saccharomonospora sp. NPDC046836]|uniref:hypothetical protein n=1 Tax=Saccharomonospora sp. NPDC046836 TaxID=3156921 RepID=UPI0033D331A8
MTTGHGHADHADDDLPLFLDGPELADELARRKDVQPIRSADDLACEGIFDTDEELHEFIEYTYATRRANLT